MSGGTLAIMAIAVVIIVAIAMMSSAAERRRSEALEAWAGERGWTYDRERPELVARFRGTPFRRGRSNAKARHVLTAERRGHGVLAFEYSYTTSSHNGQNTTTTKHCFGIVAVSTPRTPTLEVGNEHFGHTLLGLLGVHDLQVGESTFDETFRIAAEDDAFALAVLGPELRAWLLERAEERIPFRFTGDHLLTWYTGALEPEKAVATADTLIDLMERVPAQVWEGTRG
ncbi:hypothetical protein [Nocardiopsis sp. L17-MgMaSL7]|uniref:hypothetical protein n=1 Tax=Nocardiopsis sp. L17-MgMaSL7 TaxID=1938893 RepID=UPI000D70FB83|nr:hypothetical protein [Nocardiopsis sp. L17-MgMaSL7]PWV46834.1 hypothetical protein BDW27_113143 [Nocardiopsis sp. L17-MgMaSL7]